MKSFYWQLKREFWEHRGGLLRAPIIAALVFLGLNLLSMISAEVLHFGQFNLGGVNLAQIHDSNTDDFRHGVGIALDIALLAPTALLAIVLGFVVFAYCLGALYNDRRDRSILFWKSLPVSDSSTVLAKLATALLVAPALTIVVGLLAGMVLLLMVLTLMAVHGLMPWQVIGLAHPFKVGASLLALLPLYAVWALPAAGWLLMCSAWSRSKPFLVAVVLPIAVSLVLGWFQLLHVVRLPFVMVLKALIWRLLISVFPGSWLMSLHLHDQTQGLTGSGQYQAMLLSSQYAVFAHLDLWLGVAAGAIFVAAAIWFRRWKDEV